MRGCSTGLTTQVLVGLHRIGLVGLRETLKQAESSGLMNREPAVDFILEQLSASNYIPTKQTEPYRQAIWREYQRYRGEDIRDLFSEVDVVVLGEPGEKRDEFVGTLFSVFADYEIKPIISFQPPAEKGPHPQLLLGDQAVIKGSLPRQAFKLQVRKYITDW